MEKMTKQNRIVQLLKTLYWKLVKINDSPLKIALGFGLGVFIGVIPAMGPVIALALAFLFRVNRASAFLGSVLFNTWFTIITLLLAIKIGAAVTGLSYNEIYEGWKGLIKDFKWEKIFQASFQDVLIPIGIGYLIISSFFSAVATVVVYIITQQIKMKKIKSGDEKSRE